MLDDTIAVSMLVSAALRHASSVMIDCVLVRRGDANAGAIFLHIDRLDGQHQLGRVLDFDGHFRWQALCRPAMDRCRYDCQTAMPSFRPSLCWRLKMQTRAIRLAVSNLALLLSSV